MEKDKNVGNKKSDNCWSSWSRILHKFSEKNSLLLMKEQVPSFLNVQFLPARLDTNNVKLELITEQT